jgi:hypothetical protein
MQAHRFRPVKGSVFPDPAELCEGVVEEVVLEPTELGADWESVDELGVVEVVVEALVPLALVLWWPEWG